MKISELKIGDIAQFKDQKIPFIVIDRYFGVVTPDSTIVLYGNGESRIILWHYFNPEIEYLGKGKLEVKITKVSDQ